MFNDLKHLAYLYVEDDDFSRDIMVMMFERMLEFPNLYVFTDSTDFMNRVNALPIQPSLIMLDIHMTPENGFALLGRLRSCEAFAKTPIIAVTASVMNEEIRQLHHAGFDGAIAKPIDAQTFPDLLYRIIQGEKVWHVVG